MQTKKLSILTYNTCFGLKSNTLWEAYNSTWRIVHKRRDPKEINSKADFTEVFDMIKSLNPDIIVLNEVFDNLQTEHIKSNLQKLGYANIFIGNSEHHDFPLKVSSLIASKYPSKKLKNNLKFKKGIPGTGGGAVLLDINNFELCLLGVHVACMKKYLSNHLKYLERFYSDFSKKYKNLIIVGDLNRTPKFYKKKTDFMNKMNHIIAKRTFPSFFPWYKPLEIFFKNLISGQIDNVLYKGNITPIFSKVIEGKRSDHKPLFVKLKIN